MSEESVAAEDQTLRRRIIGVVLLASFGIITVAERDLRSRPAEEIRGSKLLWRMGSTNAVIALVYLRWGRRIPESA